MELRRSGGVRGERTDHTKKFRRSLAGFGLTWHRKVHFSTFDGKLGVPDYLLMLDACLMVHGSWLKALGSWPREARRGAWLMARGRPGPGDPEARGPGPGRKRASGSPGPGRPWP